MFLAALMLDSVPKCLIYAPFCDFLGHDSFELPLGKALVLRLPPGKIRPDNQHLNCYFTV